MNWLDIAIVILLIVPALIGLKAGIIKILLTVAGLIVGVVLAGRFSTWLGGQLTFISDPGIAKVVAFALILIVVLVLASVAAALIKKFASALLLGWINRLGGAVLGLALGIIFCGAVVTMWVNFLGAGSTIENSAMAKFLVDTFPIVLGLLPKDFDAVRSFFR
jgi:membrane protein required for colicin V production